MTLMTAVLAVAIMLLVAERLLIYAHARRRKGPLPFIIFYTLGGYKPTLIALGLAAYPRGRTADIVPILVLLALAVLVPLVSYPLARHLYKRRLLRGGG